MKDQRRDVRAARRGALADDEPDADAHQNAAADHGENGIFCQPAISEDRGIHPHERRIEKGAQKRGKSKLLAEEQHADEIENDIGDKDDPGDDHRGIFSREKMFDKNTDPRRPSHDQIVGQDKKRGRRRGDEIARDHDRKVTEQFTPANVVQLFANLNHSLPPYALIITHNDADYNAFAEICA